MFRAVSSGPFVVVGNNSTSKSNGTVVSTFPGPAAPTVVVSSGCVEDPVSVDDESGIVLNRSGKTVVVKVGLWIGVLSVE